MKKWLQLIILALVLASGVCSSLVLADDYPDRPIRVIVPFPAGRAADANARLFLAKMSEFLGQSIIIDNRPGASGIVGTSVAAKAKPDGYTLYSGAITSVAMVPYMYPKLPFDMEHDFIPVTQFSRSAVGLATSPELPVKNWKELVELSKRQPLNVATSGIGSNNHLYAAWFAALTGAKFNYIHYNTSNWSTDVMAGRVDLVFGGVAAYLGAYKGGKLKIIAIGGNERSPALPNVPTFVESGLAEYQPTAWGGLFAPAGVPRAVIERLAGAAAKAGKTKELIDGYAFDVGEPVGSSSAEFAAFVKAEQAKWRGVIKAANVTLE